MWLTGALLRDYGRSSQKCNYILFKQQPFHKFHFHPIYSWFNYTKGNKILYLHYINAFLSIMRQTLAGATLQIICKSQMDIYYHYLYVFGKCVLIEVNTHIDAIVKLNEHDIN